MQKLAEICVHRPVFATMLVLGLTVIGGVSFFTLGVDRYPRIEMPTVSVQTTNPGATPQSIETEVTDSIEAAVNTVAGIDELRSTSTEGNSRVNITFDLSKDPDVAAQEVRSKVDPVIRNLPETADPPTVQKQDPDSAPVMMYSISAPMPVVELTTYLEQTVQKRLETVNGVGEVLLFGARRRQVQVRIDPERLNSYGLTTTDVASALRAQNLELPGGRIDEGSRDLSVRTLGRLLRPVDFADLVVATRNGYAIKIRDIGEVIDGGEDPTSVSVLNGRPAVSLAIRKQSGVNTVALVDGIKRAHGRDPADAAADVPGADDPRRLGVHPRVARRDRRAPRARRHPRCDRRLRFPVELPLDAHRRPRDSDVDHRRVRADGRDGLHAEPDHDARADADGRHRDRRRDRRAREHLPVRRREGHGAVPGGDRGHARDRPGGHGDDAVAARRVPAGRLHGRHRRPLHVVVRSDCGGGDRGQPARVVHADADARGALDQARSKERPRARTKCHAGGSTATSIAPTRGCSSGRWRTAGSIVAACASSSLSHRIRCSRRRG